MTDAGKTPSPLAIRLFGPLEFLLNGTPLPRLRSRKGHWLLALLVLRHGCEVERSWLAGLLWPNSSESEAYASLRVSLSHLRRALGPEAGRLRSPTLHTLTLDLEGMEVDVAAFDCCVRRGDEASLEQAVALYRGPLLEGCAEEWAFQERQVREQAYLQALETLAAGALTRGDPAAAANYAGRAVAVEPLRESAQRLLMQALAAHGNYAAALLTYRELRLLLRGELNAEPDPETQALFQQLRAEARSKAAPSSRRQAPGLTPREPASRPAERQALYHAWSLEPGAWSRSEATTLTFLLTDIEGSTKHWLDHPDAMRDALTRHDALAADLIEQHDGRLLKHRGEGDSLFAVFARATDAVAAALAFQRAFAREAWPTETPLQVRVALHTGEAELREGDYYGLAVNHCARLRSVGHGGQTLLSQTTAALVRDDLPEGASLRELGTHRLKDLQRAEPIVQLLHRELPAEFPPLRSLEAFAHNLPVQLTRFIGREREIAEVKRLLPTTHLLTLTGVGGCGKTRLALQVAADLVEAHPDGVWLVELAALSDLGLVPQAVASALGVREGPERSLTEALADYLRPRSPLLLLDNCEHLLSACAQLVDRLLRACPNLRILATSREALNLSGEQVYRVPSLSLPDAGQDPSLERLQGSEAVQLFVDRALANQPAFALTTANAAVVAEVCRRLDGIPLAIELAAARVKALPVEKLAERLDGMFRLLTGGSRAALPRHQTLQALIDWSYNLLSPSEQTLLRRLSVFAGGFSLEAAEGVCAGDGIEDWEALDLLTSLVEKSLVQYDERGGDEARYRLLETVRQYARDRLEERREATSVCGRHLEWFLSLAERAAPELRRWDQLVWLDRLEAEHDNLRAALEWSGSEASGAEASLRLAAALEGFWITRGFWREGRQFLEAALARGIDAPAALRARALAALAQLARFTGDFALLVSSAQEGLDQARAAGDRWAIARSLFLLGLHAREMSDFQRAAALAEQSFAVAQEVGDPWLHAQALGFVGLLAWWRQGEHEQARRQLDEALTLMRSVGDRSTLTILLAGLANVSLRQKRFDQAVVYAKEAIAYCQELGDLRGTAWSMFGFAVVAVAQGRDERAARLLGAMARMLEELGHRLPPGFQAWCEETTARARTALGEDAFAAAWAEGQALTLEHAVAFALADDVQSPPGTEPPMGRVP